MPKENESQKLCPLTRIMPTPDGKSAAKPCNPVKCAWGTGAPGYEKCCVPQIIYELYKARTSDTSKRKREPTDEEINLDEDENPFKEDF